MPVEDPIYAAIDEDEDEPGFFRKFWIPLTVFAILLGGGIPVAIKFLHAANSTSRKADQVTMVRLLPLPPPPPPPPPPPQKVEEPVKQDEKMIAEDHPDSTKKADDKPAPKAADPAPLGTSIKGDGAGDGFNIGGGNGTGTGSIGGDDGGPGGSRWGAFPSEVSSKVTEALKSDPRTRDAALNIQVRVWADITGRITRATLHGSTGNPQLDDAIQNGVLTGIQLPEAPRAGMPMPIVLRLSAVRPN